MIRLNRSDDKCHFTVNTVELMPNRCENPYIPCQRFQDQLRISIEYLFAFEQII